MRMNAAANNPGEIMPTLRQIMSVAAVVISGCSTTYSDTQYTTEQRSRIVLNAVTRQPVPGVIIAFKWVRTDADIEATRHYCVHAEIAMSDRDGRYQVPAWRGLWPMIVAQYKAGMTRVWQTPRDDHGVDLIKPFDGASKQRFEELERLVNSLNCPDEDIHEMQSLFVAIADEAQSMVHTDADARWAESFQITADAAKYGSEVAKMRHAARLNELGKQGGKQ